MQFSRMETVFPVLLRRGGAYMRGILVKDLIVEYEQELVRLGYSSASLRNYRIFFRQIGKYFEGQGETLFSEKTALAFLDYRYQLSEVARIRDLTRNEIAVRQMVRKLMFFADHGTIRRLNGVAQRHLTTDEFIAVLSEYGKWCVEHGYAPSTRERLRDRAIKFLSDLERHGVRRCADIRPEAVVQYVNGLTEYSYRSIGLILSDTRSLLTFLYEHRITTEDLTPALPHQQSRQETGLPAVWSRADVLKLLGAVDRGNPCGKRDYAILLLVATLGIRVGDIRALRLQNLHWETNTIEFVQSKTQQMITLPLLKEVGWAIIDYLKHGRPDTESDNVFVRHIPPFGKVHDRHCFYHIVRRCIRIARVTPPVESNRGMHSLRRTLATGLLSEGIPLSTIAGVLGHRNDDSTFTYFRSEIDLLRTCALSEPEVHS